MINEHDINDMCPLYELHRGDKFVIADEHQEVRVPPAHVKFDLSDVFTFFNIDGMYSFCKDSKGQAVHLAAWTKVNKVKDKDNG